MVAFKGPLLRSGPLAQVIYGRRPTAGRLRGGGLTPRMRGEKPTRDRASSQKRESVGEAVRGEWRGAASPLRPRTCRVRIGASAAPTTHSCVLLLRLWISTALCFRRTLSCRGSASTGVLAPSS